MFCWSKKKPIETTRENILLAEKKNNLHQNLEGTLELYNYSMKILESETSSWEKQKNICLVNETKHYLFKTNKNIIRILKLNRHDPTGQNHGKTISLFKNKSK